MGNKASSQSFPTEAVIAQVVKTVNTFGPLLVKGYGIAVIRKLQQLHEEEHEGGDASAEADGFLLERPPVATEPMERGWITKLGDIKKNWKRRYFVATEEADNFVVYYFEKERDAATPLKAKGSIHPCGYVVRHTTPEEDARDRKDKDASEFGLVLEPLDRKRTWVLRFDSADMRAKWRAVLQFGASRCEAPLAKDPILNDAFRDAYARTRRALGLGGYFKLDRPEKEQLALLATQACEANVLAALFDGLGSGAGGAASAGSGSSGLGSDASSSASSRAGGSGSTGSAARPASLSTGSAGGGGAAAGGGSEADKLRAAAERELERIVTAIVDSAWPAILQRVEMRRDAVEEVAETSLGAILRDEDARKTALRAALSKPVVRPAVGEIAAPVVTTVLGALLKPLYKAHKEAIKMLWHRIHDIVERGLKEDELRQFYRDTRWQSQTLGPAFRKIRALTRGEVDDADSGEGALKLLSELTVSVPELEALMGGVSLYEVEMAFEDSLRQLVGWGIYSFVAAVERARGGVTPIECLHGVMRSMIHDSKLRQRSALQGIFKAVLGPVVRPRVVAIPQVKEVEDRSVLHASPPPFLVVPATGAGAAAAATAASPSSASAAGGAGGPAIPIPAAAPVPRGKKALAAVHAEVKAAPLEELFYDADWALDEIIDEAVAAAVAAGVEERTSAMLARLDKLPGKLGFSSH